MTGSWMSTGGSLGGMMMREPGMMRRFPQSVLDSREGCHMALVY